MNESSFIDCLGCGTTVDAHRPACPGCGRCLNCGLKRASTIEHCDKCELAYCECCGRCPSCLELRYSDVGPCECGHPTDEAKLQQLIRNNAATAIELQKFSMGCFAIGIGVVAAAVVGYAVAVHWLGR